MAVRDAQTPKVAAWTGIDNLRPADALRPGAARELVNVDLNAALQLQRRGGYSNRWPATMAHSLASSSVGMLCVLDGVLARLDDAPGFTPIRAGLPGELAPLSYAELNGDVYWTNGHEFRCVRGHDLADTPGWMECEATPDVQLSTNGGLRAGEYLVAQTFVDASGRESGADNAVLVTVPEGGGLLVTAAGVSPEAVRARFYVSAANSEVFYFAREVALPHPAVLIGAGGERGKPIETLFHAPLPPGQLLAAHNARLWMAVGPLLYFGEAFRYGLAKHDAAYRFAGDIDLLQPCGTANAGGLYVAAGKRVFWMAGADPATMVRTAVHPFGVQPGSGRTVPGKWLGLEYEGPVATWVSLSGAWMAGLPSGQVVSLTEGQMALPAGERAATLVRERHGLRQIVLALQGQITGNTAAVSDAAAATVIRNGIEVS